MIKVKIGSQTISFPSSGDAANWAQGVISFAQAVSLQLQGLASAYDILPTVQILTTDTNTNLAVSTAVFPSGAVRSFGLTYAIYRTNGTLSVSERGTVNAVYDSLHSTWQLQHEFEGPRQADGTAYNTFAMSGDQLVVTTAPIGGAYDSTNSEITFSAKTILVSDIN